MRVLLADAHPAFRLGDMAPVREIDDDAQVVEAGDFAAARDGLGRS